MKTRLTFIAAAIAGLLAACSHPNQGESQTSPPGETVLSAVELQKAKTQVDFKAHVKPILEARCVMCHNRKTLPGHMSLENRKLALARTALGVPIVPGHPEQSLILTNIKNGHAHVHAMPPVGERITKDELAVLTKWITDGATWPEGRAGKLNPEWTPRE